MQLTPSSASIATLSTRSNSRLIKCQPCVRPVPGYMKIAPENQVCPRGAGIRCTDPQKRRIKSVVVEMIFLGCSEGGRRRKKESFFHLCLQAKSFRVFFKHTFVLRPSNPVSLLWSSEQPSHCPLLLSWLRFLFLDLI